MTAINFPDSPTINDIYTVDGRSWRWTGSVWESVTATVSGPTGPAGPTGPTGPSGGPTGPTGPRDPLIASILYK